jgi:hypothetical protein
MLRFYPRQKGHFHVYISSAPCCTHAALDPCTNSGLGALFRLWLWPEFLRASSSIANWPLGTIGVDFGLGRRAHSIFSRDLLKTSTRSGPLLPCYAISCRFTEGKRKGMALKCRFTSKPHRFRLKQCGTSGIRNEKWHGMDPDGA